MPNSHAPFNRAAHERTLFESAFDEFENKIRERLKYQPNLDRIEPLLRADFKTFLKKMGYELALANFDELLKEKGGDRFLRKDGTVNWYHEFIPVFAMMKIVRVGRENKGIDMAATEPYGGLEVGIASHLRHDSVEDFLKKMKALYKQQNGFLNQIKTQNPVYSQARGHDRVKKIMTTVYLETQKEQRDKNTGKIKIGDNGKPLKEKVVDYTGRMVDDERGNPFAFLLKQLDIVHNIATILMPEVAIYTYHEGDDLLAEEVNRRVSIDPHDREELMVEKSANKFTPDRIQKRLDRIEDMYGARLGFYWRAKKRWPEFVNAFEIADGMMGQLVYPLFRYLETVELYYKESEPTRAVSGQFLEKALFLDLPEQLHPVHIGMKRMMESVNPATDPEKYERLRTLMTQTIFPELKEYAHKFPYIDFGHQRAQPRPNGMVMIKPNEMDLD